MVPEKVTMMVSNRVSCLVLQMVLHLAQLKASRKVICLVSSTEFQMVSQMALMMGSYSVPMMV